MTRALLLVFVLLPGTAAGQGAVSSQPPESEVRAEEPRGTISLADQTATPPVTQPRPSQAPERYRRRPSMVGYITDAGIQSQVRIRFDAGTTVDSADRAEFFYPKCGCYRDLPTDHPAYDPDARGPGPGIATDMNYQQFFVQTEFAVHERFSVYGELPVRWLQPKAFVPDTGSFGDQTGLSDLRAGIKWALVASDAAFLTLQLQGNFPTGDGRKGLGVEHFSFEPALLYNQSLADRVNLESQFGFVFPADGSDGIATTSETFSGNVLYYGIGPSFEVYRSDTFRFSPVVELLGWYVMSGFQTSTFAEADGVSVVNLKVGGRFDFRDRNSVFVGYGHHLTDDVWYDTIVRVEYRYTF